jgi:hypothetical protein
MLPVQLPVLFYVGVQHVGLMVIGGLYLCGIHTISRCVNNKIAINEELDAYLCTSSQLSSELRLFDIYAERVFKSS